MTVLPEKIRRTLEKLVSEMRVKEDVYGVGLFGSWSRGDATPFSDVDLFILNKGNFPGEYIERVVINGLFIDLNHVPRAWIQGPIPPEIDQKLYEMQVLYDRDWSLTNTKLLMDRCYASPERVEIRTEAHVVDSDVYLSRATSAYSRDDYPSAYFFAVVAFEAVLRVLVEVALEQSSISRFVEKVEASTTRLNRQRYYTEYLRLARLDKANSQEAREKLELFKTVWDEAHLLADENPRVLQSSHFKVRTKLSFYLNPAFLQGVMMRANSLIDSGRLAEMFHYLDVVSLDVLENYVWLKALVGNVRVDYTTLMRSLKLLEKKNLRNYDSAVQLLGLRDVDKALAANAIAEVREVILQIRRERKALIKKRFTKG
jgi:hypothetical protein